MWRGKCINLFVYRVSERERKREQQKEGGREGALSLEDAETTSSQHVMLLHPELFHLLIDQPVEARNKPLMPD